MRRVKADQEREDILQDVGIEWAHTLSNMLCLSLVRKKMNYLGVIRKLKMLSMGASVKIKLQAIGMKAYR